MAERKRKGDSETRQESCYTKSSAQVRSRTFRARYLSHFPAVRAFVSRCDAKFDNGSPAMWIMEHRNRDEIRRLPTKQFFLGLFVLEVEL